VLTWRGKTHVISGETGYELARSNLPYNPSWQNKKWAKL